MNTFKCLLLSFPITVALISCSDNYVIDNPPQPENVFQRDTIDDSNDGFYQLALITKEPGTIITSKDIYVDSISLTLTKQEGSIDYKGYGKIKGRGNSTWTHSPKKPYTIKLYEKASLTGLPKDKSWVLLANYFDPTHLRNSIASFISSKISYLEYTPHYSFVKLSLNENPCGIYQLGEKLKIGKNRVDVGDEGYLLEVDFKYDETDPIINLSHHTVPINIKEPDVKIGDAKYNFIKEYILKAEEILYSDCFLDEHEGWRKYFDESSFVEWYLVNEIAKNPDSNMGTSCYMNLSRGGGKLKMGPIWDFDVAFGNYHFLTEEINDSLNQPSGIHTRDSWIYNRLFEDRSFELKVKSRFMEYYNSRSDIFRYIDLRAEKVMEQITSENQLWGRLCSPAASTNEVQVAYKQQVDYLKEWLEARFQWLYQYFTNQT